MTEVHPKLVQRWALIYLDKHKEGGAVEAGVWLAFFVPPPYQEKVKAIAIDTLKSRKR